MIGQARKIAVLMGGVGAERQVSLETGRGVCRALQEGGLTAQAVDVAPDRLDVLDDPSFDVFFLALHGDFGEDGTLQQILEDRRLCYTGSGPRACRLAFDKWASKEVFSRVGVRTPPAVELTAGFDAEALCAQAAAWSHRWVVKPVCQGSSVGVCRVDRLEDLAPCCRHAVERYGRVLVEAFVPGREVTVAVLHGRALPLIEIRPVAGFYDYQAKYCDDRTEMLFGTLPETVESRVQRQAEAAYEAFGLRDVARADFLLDGDEPVALEFNTIPGMTSHSLVPKAAARAGMDLAAVCRSIVEQAWARYIARG